ncbi:DGQHR domain-containing protein, partial [Candidatus Bipolaricaulota bacterium]|nr:DGQHR domain-containing protein [Candidatus Bipolaricaulota bacterium]
ESRDADGFDDAEYRWVFVYSSLHHIDREYEDRYPGIKFLRYSALQYFVYLSKTIKASVRSEILRFLAVDISGIGSPRFGEEKRVIQALVLSESPSGFPAGHKVVTFLMDPETLLEQCYVLRRDGWEETSCLYQRMLRPSKIKEMRGYLASEGRVFVNNVIATLPPDTRFQDEAGNQLEPEDLEPMGVVKLDVPRTFGSIGIVDGQHRVYSYHEGQDDLEPAIAKLRTKQHLLVSGIVYPSSLSSLEKRQFEAKLFLEINDKQTKTRPDLKQAIQAITHPFSSLAIAKRVMDRLSERGPLSGHMEQHFFERGRVKTASIVNYGLRHLVSINAENGMYRVWSRAEKELLAEGTDLALLEDYITYCSNHLSRFISGLKRHLPGDMWTPDKKPSRALTTTSINGLIFCLRLVIEAGETGNADYYADAFAKCRVDFRPDRFMYRSSHWRNLGRELYEQCFI